MAALVALVTIGIGLSLTALAVLGVRNWRREDDVASGWFAGAVGLLGLVVLGDLIEETSIVRSAATIGFLGSAFSLLKYRDALFPLKQRTRFAASALTLVVIALVLATGVPDEGGPTSPVQMAGMGLLLILLLGFIAEPVVRFWIQSRGRPVIQRSRARSLSYGYGGMLLILMVSGVANQGGDNDAMQLAAGVGVLAVVGLLYVSFSPPRLLRRIWREHEQRALLAAAPLFATKARTETASAALLRATRLAGAEAGFVADAGGELLALHSMTADEANALHDELRHSSEPRVTRAGHPPHQVLVVPVPLEAGSGSLAVVAGPVSPRMGAEEVEVITHYAEIAGLALDHTALDELRSAFLTALSHELRTPLTTIVGNAQTLLRPEIEERLSPEQRHDLLSRLVASTQVLQRKLEELLDLDRASRGLHLPQRRLVDMEQAVEQTLERIGVRELRKVEVQVKPMLVGLDPSMVDRILESLLMNAIKHTPADSKIWIRVGREHEGILVAVEDDGPGVPPEFRKTIFEPFHRGPKAPVHSPGTAVALALVGHLAALHGGRAWVEERNGGGASFRVILRTARQFGRDGAG